MDFKRHSRVVDAAREWQGVVSRRTLRAMGISHDVVRQEVQSGRWRTVGNQTVVPHTGEVAIEGRQWSAIWEVGSKIAVLDGVTALQVAGLTGYTEADIHVSVVHTCAVKQVEGVRIHKVIRRGGDEVAGAGVPRTRPPVAALRAAYWAKSNRQAALILILSVQQRLTTPDQLLDWSKRVRGRKRRAFVQAVLLDIADGVRALGELDFARLCRERGLPEPSRQVLVKSPQGRSYLDVRWEGHALVVEIDGAQHREGLQVTADNLSRNEVALGRDRVLRIDLLGLRLRTDEHMDQVARGLARVNDRGQGDGSPA